MADSFKINKAYAERYNIWRQKEEIQKLKARYGDEYEDLSSSSDSEEDDQQELSEKFDKGWLRAYSALKGNDASLYKKDVKFYEDDSEDSSEGSSEEEEEKEKHAERKSKKERPMYLKDYERKVILEKGGIVDEGDSDEEDQPSRKGETLGYYQEQEHLRKSIVAATEEANEDLSDDALLKKRQKTEKDKEKEEEDYLSWLKGQKDSSTDEKGIDPVLVPLKQYWGRPDLDDGEKFLRNYILNKQYMDNDDESVPTYDELVQDPDDLSDDEELLTLQDKFERKYNFRYEEPGAAEMQTFPRDIEDSLRQKDNKRKDQREMVKERKEREKEKKKEELKQLKNMKRQEIMSKIAKLKEITGNPSLGFDENDLEEEFDPKKHDELMKQCFNDTYYEEGEGEETKPEFEMSDDDENWDSWTGEVKAEQSEGGPEGTQEDFDGPYADDPDFVMDADYDPLMAREKKRKKNKKKSKLAEALLKEKPTFDPDSKSFEEYFDEYYKLDFEDIVGDMPTRFRYRKVPANGFGLSVDEVLNARDKELNSWVSIKKMSQYRTEEEEFRDEKIFSSKGRNIRKKQNILTSLFDSGETDDAAKSQAGPSGEKLSSKNKKQEKKNKAKQRTDNPDTSTATKNTEPGIGGKKQKDADSSQEEIVTPEKHKKKKKRKHENDADASQDSGIGNELLKAAKHKLDASEDEESVSAKKTKVEAIDEPGETVAKKKKKKEITDQDEESETNEVSGNKITDTGVTVSNDATETRDKVQEKKVKKALRKKRRKAEKKQQEAEKMTMTDDRLKAYGINPHRYKYMSKEDMFTLKPRKNTDKSSKWTP